MFYDASSLGVLGANLSPDVILCTVVGKQKIIELFIQSIICRLLPWFGEEKWLGEDLSWSRYRTLYSGRR